MKNPKAEAMVLPFPVGTPPGREIRVTVPAAGTVVLEIADDPALAPAFRFIPDSASPSGARKARRDVH